MLGKILKFELKQRFTNRLTLLFFLMLVFQGVWYTKATYDYYKNEAVLINAASVFYKNLAGGGMLMIIIIAIITGSVLYKDLQYKTGQWFYSFPIKEKSLFLGRFLAAFAINVLIALGYLMGMLLTPYSGLGDASLFGPAPIGQMLQGFAYLLVPNLFLLTSIILAAVVFFRKLSAGYLFVLVTVMLFLVMQSVAEGSGVTPLLIIVEPFGFVGVSDMLDHFTTPQKNTGYLTMSGYLLVNRLVWLGISSILLLLAYRKFSFKYFVTKSTKATQLKDDHTTKPISTLSMPITRPQLSFSNGEFLRKLLNLSVLEFKNVVRPVSFKVILGIILTMVFLQNVLWNATYYIGPQEPLTVNFTNFRIIFGVFIIILLMIWSGELFFKEKVVNIWQITGTLPVPAWVSQLSRFIAMSGVALVLALAFMALGIITQIMQGGWYYIDLGLYINDLLGYQWGWLTYVLQIALVFFLASFTGNRFLTHILSVGYFFVLLIGFEFGLIEQVRFGFAMVPGIEDYSTVSGYGILGTSASWYFFMWAILAVVFILLGVQFWDRGSSTKWYLKLVFKGKQLNILGKVMVLVFLGCFVFLQSFIYKNVNKTGNFTSVADEEKEDAAYEQKYHYIRALPQPKYSQVDLRLDFYPQQRKARYEALIRLQNNRKQSIDTLYFNYPDFVKVKALTVDDKPLKIAWKDEPQRLVAYLLPNSLKAGAELKLTMKAKKQYLGFVQDAENIQADLMKNGSFGSVQDFLPVLGFSDDRVLKENRKRQEQGLAKLSSRMRNISDKEGRQQNAYTPDALLLKGSLTLSTSASQHCIAPGTLVKQWQKNHRNYFTYVLNGRVPFNWHLGSANYASLKGEAQGITTYVLSHPKHLYNVKLYQKILHQSIRFTQEKLGTLSGKEIRLAEIPHYQEKFYTCANLIAVSEKEGWLAKTHHMKEKAYLHLTIASQVMKQWIQQNLWLANVQGADMLQTALPEALALHFVKQKLGEKAVKILLDKKKTEYERKRNNDTNGEPTLVRSDGADYLAINKGAIELYNLYHTLGAKQFLETIRQYKLANNTTSIVFDNVVQGWMEKLPTKQRKVYREKFEQLNSFVLVNDF